MGHSHVANGKVFIGTQNSVAVFGLLTGSQAVVGARQLVFWSSARRCHECIPVRWGHQYGEIAIKRQQDLDRRSERNGFRGPGYVRLALSVWV